MADPKQITKTTETYTTVTQTQGNPPPAPASVPAGGVPAVQTTAAKWASMEAARLEGSVTPNKAPTQYWFEYGNSASLGSVTSAVSIGDGESALPVSTMVTGLDPTTTHYIRLVAENKYGKAAGDLLTLHAAQNKKVTEVVSRTPSALSTILAVVGLIIVLIIVVWGLLHIASLLTPWFSSLFGPQQHATPTLQVTAPASVTSGSSFTVNWTYPTTAAGSYAFLYSCNDSLRFETAGTNGTENTIPCGAAFSVSGKSLAVTPILTGTKPLAESLTIIFEPTAGTAQAQGSTSVTVNPGAAPAPVVQKTITASGPADLSVTIISASADQNGWATLVFDVSNIGSGNSGNYSFVAYLPTRQSFTYYSPTQASLSPGSHIVNTLRFSDVESGAVSIIVDPSNAVNDSNRGNNYAAQVLSMPYGYIQQQNYYTNGYNYVQPETYVY